MISGMDEDASRDEETSVSGEVDPADLLMQEQSRLHAYARLEMGPLLRAKEGTDDIVQSVYREVLQRIDKQGFPGEALARKWLYKKCMQKILDRAQYHRAQRRDVRRRREESNPRTTDAPPMATTSPRRRFSPRTRRRTAEGESSR